MFLCLVHVLIDVLQDDTLQELYLSQDFISGSLPDVVPPNSPLRLLYTVNHETEYLSGLTGVQHWHNATWGPSVLKRLLRACVTQALV